MRELEPADELKVQALQQRLHAPLTRRDEIEFVSRAKPLTRRYGAKILGHYVQRLPPVDRLWANSIIPDLMPPDQRAFITAEAYRIIAQQILSLGKRCGVQLRLGFDFKACEHGFLVSPEAKQVLSSDGNPVAPNFPTASREEIAAMGLKRPFFHPLCEASEASPENPGGEMNDWFLASSIINVAQGWYPPELVKKTPEEARRLILGVIPQVAPNCNPHDLIFRASYDDRELMRLCQLLIQGVEALTDRPY